MKRLGLFLLVVSLGLPGCWGRNSKKALDKKSGRSTKTEINTDSTVNSFFDRDIGAFELADDGDILNALNAASAPEATYTWIEDKDRIFKNIYFDFDKEDLRADQKSVFDLNVSVAKAELSKDHEGQKATLFIEGHACNSAGTHAYNQALSERRAKKIADALSARGVNGAQVKLIGRGDEFPTLVDGKPVTGNRQQQAKNRRVEMRVIYS